MRSLLLGHTTPWQRVCPETRALAFMGRPLVLPRRMAQPAGETLGTAPRQ